MSGKQRILLLSCGSFNPVTNMHLRMFEIARDYLHTMGNIVIGGVISPVHDAYGKKELIASTDRLEMLKLSLANHEWVRLSDWECKQEGWTRTKHILQYHQNHLNAVVSQDCDNEQFDVNENEIKWIPDNAKNGSKQPIVIKLLCGADLLESFGTPGLWSDEDLEEIVGRHGLVVISRANTNPGEFIYNSDLLSRFMANIHIVTDWITNEISSTKIRRALRRNESVKYLIPEKVLEYINKNNLYGSQGA